jgi:hypothetical protein
MSGIFGTTGGWSTGYDLFGENTTLAVGGVFDSVNSSPTVKNAFARFSGATNAKGCQYTLNQFSGRSFNTNLGTHIAGFAYQPVIVAHSEWHNRHGDLLRCHSGHKPVLLGYRSFWQLAFISWQRIWCWRTIRSWACDFNHGSDASNGPFQVRLNGNSTPIINYSRALKNTSNTWVSRFLIGSAGHGEEYSTPTL